MNKKGVTMISLVFYVLSFFVIISVVGTINIYIAKNIDAMNAETDSSYVKHQVDKYLRKHFNRKDSFVVTKNDDIDANADYIDFTKKGDSEHIYRIIYYPENDATSKGYAFFETHKGDDLVKKVLITDNIYGFNIFESETALAKTLEIEILTRKGDQNIESVLVYGIER